MPCQLRVGPPPSDLKKAHPSQAWGLVTTLLRTVNRAVNDSALRRAPPAPASPSSRRDHSSAMEHTKWGKSLLLTMANPFLQ